MFRWLRPLSPTRAPFHITRLGPRKPALGSPTTAASPPRVAEGAVACACAHHRALSAVGLKPASGGTAIGLVPLLLCAFCPACLSVWAPLVGLLGWHFFANEVVHRSLLGGSIMLSLVLGTLRARRRRYWVPVGVTALGCVLLILGEIAGDYWPLTLAGTAGLLAAFFVERRAPRSAGLNRVSA